MIRVIGAYQRVRIGVRVNEQTAAPDRLLLEGLINGHRRAGYHVLVVDIGRDTDDAAGSGADVDELHHRIGPHHVAVDRILIREHPLREALADDDDLFAAPAIGFVEIAPGDDRDTERREKSGRDHPETRARIFFARCANVAVGGKLNRSEATRIAPGNLGTDGDAIYAGQRL